MSITEREIMTDLTDKVMSVQTLLTEVVDGELSDQRIDVGTAFQLKDKIRANLNDLLEELRSVLS